MIRQYTDGTPAKAAPHAAPPQAGFTLLEVLTALAVLGILLVTLGGGLRFGGTAWDAQRRLADAQDGLEPVDRLLRRLIAEADPGAGGGQGFQGTAHALAFVTRLPRSYAALPVPDAAVALGVDARGQLVLRWRPAPHAAPRAGPPPIEQAVLMTGVRSLDCAYARPVPDGLTWSNTWTAAGPPALVRLSIRFRADSLHHWPVIVAAPRRSLPPS